MTVDIRAYRCEDGRCRKLSTKEMINYYGRCKHCYSRRFTNTGKIGLFEELKTLINHIYVNYRLSRRVK